MMGTLSKPAAVILLPHSMVYLVEIYKVVIICLNHKPEVFFLVQRHNHMSMGTQSKGIGL